MSTTESTTQPPATEPTEAEAPLLDRAAVRGDLLALMQAAMTALHALDSSGFDDDDEGLAHDVTIDLDEAAAALAAARAQPSLRAALLAFADSIDDIEPDDARYSIARATGDYDS